MRLAIFVFCLSACVSTVLAQSDRSQITGTVSDPAGALVANAPVLAKNINTGLEYQTASTATGNYTLNELPVGRYELTVIVPGFKKYVRQGLDVLAAQTYRIDIGLEVGATSDSVTVTENTPLLKTESGELGHSVTGQALNSLPVLGIGSGFSGNSGIRQALAVTQLIPGATYVGDNVVRVNGTPANTETVRVEGQDSTNYTWLAAVSQNQPSVDSIQEFAVQTSNFAAEYGKAGGGVFLVTMKSGTNQFHGTAYDYMVNEILNANTALQGTARPRARRNDYGFTTGGPVWIPKVYDGHNRSFFFFNFEQFRERVGLNTPVTVPTAAYRIGDFTTALTARTVTVNGKSYREGSIFDPLSGPGGANGNARTPFVGNIIPKDRLDPVALAIQAMIPNPQGANASQLFQNFTPTGPFAQADRLTDITSLKGDHTLTDKMKISAFWSMTRTQSATSLALGADGLPDPISQARANFDWVNTIRINYDYNVTPTMLLHIGAGYVDQHGPTAFILPRDSFDPASIGLKGLPNTGIFPQITGLTGANNTGGMANMGQATAGGWPGCPACGGIHSWRPSGNVSMTWIHGNHTYKAGAEAIIGNYSYGQQSTARGLFTFSNAATSDSALFGQTIPGGATIGFPYASFLLGAVNNGTVGAATDQHMGEKSFAIFLQDTWKITRKFTLDYGVRWDYQTYLREGAGRMPSFSPTTLNPAIGRLGATIFDGFLPGHCQCNFASNYPYAIGPRLGAAYQITPKTVFRAGIGLVYAKTAAYDNLTIIGNDVNLSGPGQFIPALYLKNGVPFAPTTWPNLDPGQFPLAGTVTAPTGYANIDPNAGRPARQLQWSIGLQREVQKNLVLEATYVGNRGAWWLAPNMVAYNALTPQLLATYGLDATNPNDEKILSATVSSPNAGRFQNRLPYAGFPTNQTVAQSLRPFPQFGAIGGMYAPLGDTWYNSLQFKATKRLSHGLDATYSFTWQKSETIGAEASGLIVSGGQPVQTNDVFNRQNNKYLSGFDQPLVSQIAINYQVPRWREGKNLGSKALSWVARDWTLGTFLSYRSGTPIRVPGANSGLNNYFLQGASFANRVPGQPLFLADLNCHCFDPSKTIALNPAAWTDPAPGQWGTSAAYYDDYRFQRRPAESFNLGRTFRFTERVSFNVRAEFTNVFNRLEMPNPSSTNAATPTAVDSLGRYTNGFGFINTTGGTASLPRQGQIIGRVTF
ncbi:MAG: Cna B-type protein [Bryobacterales bacterium]|nr:Cna B-type protein [Bryobacterales bacterium]